MGKGDRLPLEGPHSVMAALLPPWVEGGQIVGFELCGGIDGTDLAWQQRCLTLGHPVLQTSWRLEGWQLLGVGPPARRT